MNNILSPISNVKIVDRNLLSPNNYNPNKVLEDNLDLLVRSILINGWTLPIVVRPDYTIIDGFHRWTVSGREPLLSKLEGKVPIVIVDHSEDESKNMYGTITHNRAKGTHLLEPMENIIKELIKNGKQVKELVKELGMKPEEIYRLSGMTKEDFLKSIVKNSEYGKSYAFKKI